MCYLIQCSVCQQHKGVVYFPKRNGYPRGKQCTACINKNKKMYEGDIVAKNVPSLNDKFRRSNWSRF